MLLRRAQPTIRKLSDPIIPVRYRVPFSDPASGGPTSPLERNPQSPRGWKHRESDGVGVGIVAALERSDGPKRPPRTSIKHISAPISICAYTRNDSVAGCKWRWCGGENREGGGLFCGSPPPADEFRTAEFLNYCHLCRKALHGKDIYIYRGEKAFCSVECRCQQIASDEFHEKCGSEALRAADVSASPYADGRLFFAGIAAA